MERITKKEGGERWKRLHNNWQREGQPGYLVIGNDTYRVLQPGDGEIIFLREDPRNYYESRSV